MYILYVYDTYIYIYIYMIHTYMCIYDTYIYMCIYKDFHTNIVPVHDISKGLVGPIYTYIYICIYVYIYMYICIYDYMYVTFVALVGNQMCISCTS